MDVLSVNRPLTRDRPFVRNWKTCVCVKRWKLGLAWNYHGLWFLQLPCPHPCPHPRASNRRARKQFNSGHLAAHASTASRCQVAVNDQPSLAFIVQPVLFRQVLWQLCALFVAFCANSSFCRRHFPEVVRPFLYQVAEACCCLAWHANRFWILQPGITKGFLMSRAIKNGTACGRSRVRGGAEPKPLALSLDWMCRYVEQFSSCSRGAERRETHMFKGGAWLRLRYIK